MASPPDQPALSIIVPVRNAGAQLDALLQSLDAQAPPKPALELIVVDDGSATPLTLPGREDARILRVDPGRGPANARNAGAAAARGAVLVFLDADVVCPPDFLGTVEHLMESHPEVGAVSFINQAYDPRDGAVKNYGAAIEHFWLTQYFVGDEPFAPISGFTTRNGAVRRAAFEHIGGFDARYTTNAHEDYDFGKRLSAHCTTVIARGPHPYHNFPDGFSRLARNYWVRVTLFVPYFLTHRPKLDKAQVSSDEGATRLVGASVPVWLTLAALPVPGGYAWGGLAAVAAAAYLASARRFLLKTREYSGGWRFPLVALGIHFLTSCVISLGAAWGLAGYFFRREPPGVHGAVQNKE